MEAKDTPAMETIRAILETEKEISFNAGYLEGHSKGWNDGVKVGMRKVVEWIRNGIVMRVPRGTTVYRVDKEKVLVQFDYTEWQAQLKEWGWKPHETHHD